MINRPLAFILAAFLCTGLLYTLVTPPFEASDESFHYPVIRHIALGQGLPVQQIGVKQAWDQEGSQPPLYYLISAGLTFWIDTADYDAVSTLNPFARVGIPGTPQNVNHARYAAVIAREGFNWRGTILAIMIIRLASLLMGAGTIYFTYLLAHELSGPTKSNTRPLLAAALVAFNPMFLFISAAINNDSLIWLLAAGVLWQVVRIVSSKTELPWRHAVGLGVVLGGAALTKISGLVLWPIVGLALLSNGWHTRAWKKFLINGALITLSASLIAGGWYGRNLLLYGEPLGLNTMVAIAGPRPSGFGLGDLLREWQSFWYSYWGVFGAFDVLAPSGVYAAYTTLVVIAALGLLSRLNKIRSLNWLPHALLILFTVTTFMSLLRWSMITMASQGRLMFTAQPVLAAYLAAGLLAWSPGRYRKIVTSVIGGALGVMALITSIHIASAYLPPAPLTTTQLPADLKLVRAQLAPGVELIGYRVESPQRLTPEETLILTLYWRTITPIPTDHNLFLHVLGQQQELAGNIDTWPGGGLRPTSLWRSGEIYRDRYVIALNAQAKTPTQLLLEMAMWEKDAAQKFAIIDEKGNKIPSVTVPIGLLDSVQPLNVKPTATADSTLEGGFTLLGYDLSPPLAAQQPITLRLYWQTSTPITNDYTVFVHLFEAQGKRVAQADAPPLNGDWLTSMWQPNRPVMDSHTFTLSTAGTYTIRVGLYDPVTVEPLPAFKADGSEWPERAIELGTFTIK